MSNEIIRKRICNGEEIDVVYRHSVPLEDINTIPGGWGYYSPMNQRTYEENGILCEQDVAIKLRDGVTIYADIYRPVGQTNIPCIMAWSIYGKRPHDMPRPWSTYGVPAEAVSSGTKYEGPDPHYWCHYGYAVANVDPRGCGHSEGEMPIWGDTEAQDGADVIEWLAQCEWCNGKIGMAGNSMLAMMQWYIAAEQPPHLAAIAPWEGCSDILREFMCEGGIPAIGFNTFVYKDLGSESSEGLMEDIPAMAVKYPNMNAYWQTKIAKFEKIEVPAYIAAGMSHLHMRGTINAYRKMSSKQKWLRIHREFEWPDAYSYEMKEDLRRFFDRYLKGIYNGWELTPRVRLDVMDAYDCDIQKQRPEEDFPLPPGVASADVRRVKHNLRARNQPQKPARNPEQVFRRAHRRRKIDGNIVRTEVEHGKPAKLRQKQPRRLRKGKILHVLRNIGKIIVHIEEEPPTAPVDPALQKYRKRKLFSGESVRSDRIYHLFVLREKTGFLTIIP